MKKLLVLLLAAVMVFSLVACGNPSSGNNDKTYEVIEHRNWNNKKSSF